MLPRITKLHLKPFNRIVFCIGRMTKMQINKPAKQLPTYLQVERDRAAGKSSFWQSKPCSQPETVAAGLQKSTEMAVAVVLLLSSR